MHGLPAAAGLKRITVSLDALDPVIFAAMSGGRGRVEDVLSGLEHAVAADFIRSRSTVWCSAASMNPKSCRWSNFRGSGQIVRFIEYMDVGNCAIAGSPRRWCLRASCWHRSTRAIAEPVDPAYRGRGRQSAIVLSMALAKSASFPQSVSHSAVIAPRARFRRTGVCHPPVCPRRPGSACLDTR